MKYFGYEYEGQEQWVECGIADVVMYNFERDIRAIIECCSVTVSKGIECLIKPKTELWIFARDGAIYKLTRGKKWRQMHKFLREYTLQEQEVHFKRLASIFSKEF